MLQTETLRLVALVEDVLRLARADAARSHLELEDVDLVQAIHKAFEPFAHAFEQKGLRLDLQLPSEQVAVAADPKRLSRILRNLVDNIARYAPADSEVQVGIETDPQQVHIDFTNTVSHLKPADLPYLFERFYRGEKSRSRQHGGAGIGLAVVKELVEAHGGTVDARLQDEMLRIRLTLPRQSAN
jgi:signal transduction histidine kinase